MDYDRDVQTIRGEHPRLAAELTGFRTLEHVLGWMQRRGLEPAGLDVVTQDEFSHDVLVPLEDGTLHVAFGVT